MTQSKPSIIAGIMLTAGSAIGAGMFSLPVVAAGMWFGWSILSMLLIWYISYLSALYILEANFLFDPGASFSTMVAKTLGTPWKLITNIAIAFLMYILLYAYFSAFANIAAHNLGIAFISDSRWLQGLFSLLFGGVLAALVWVSTRLVGRISTILVFGMGLAYIVSMFGIGLSIDIDNLLDTNGSTRNYFSYIWVGLPYFMTSFGIATIVPSLYKYYGKDVPSIKKGLLFGSLIAFGVYVIFILVAFGNISRDEFEAINSAGGNMGVLVEALEGGEKRPIANLALNLFSNFAIISSFLGVGLSLFDFNADTFSLADNKKGRFWTALITFLPSGIASFFFPNGFITAIGFAGLVVVFGFCIIPFLMIQKIRRQNKEQSYRVKGGQLLLMFFIIISLVVGICHVLSMLNYLSKW